MAMITAVTGGFKKFLLNHGHVKYLTSIFVRSPKKGDVTKCTNNCTLPLFPHANKILPRIIQKQLESYIWYETPIEQAGLKEGRGAREQIANVSDSWRAEGSTTTISNCFIDYTKDCDSVQHIKMWNSRRSVGISKHLTVLIRDLHTE
jgi:hypothetical protein